ncbi:Carboxylesterase 2 [Candidatus Ornithobacterium hominis]|uniref:alpha/beta hydrolase n=1 Tax=Candidatus Ornithobacterium hominis TaxID=2497989 RepID=UPI0024BC44BE|nr:dienelactone hydrolase family protein [Candidatus Ornithobacterium hominis]CAI9429031.1 Carboxylesterase 2 [Candidatus Ornithobacterium hominis]
MKLQTDLPLNYLARCAKGNTQNPKLLLLLHGYGSNEQDLFSFADELPQDFFVISVQAPLALPFGGYAWYEINFTDAQKFNDVLQAKEAVEKIKNFIAAAVKKFELNPEKIWLCGFSQGAILSNALALTSPENIEKVIMLSGYTAQDIIGEVAKKDFSKLDYFISHGTEDTVIPIDWARKTPQLLRSLNIEHRYEEYPSGHGLVPQNFYDLLAWIQERK